MLAPNYRAHGRFLDVVAEALPGVIVAGDSTQPVYGGNLAYEPAGPSSWFNSSTGYGTLGYGLPAAMGAKVACPDRPVVALIGDGGIQFTIGELATAVELGLALPILLWNNQGYGEIKQYMLDRNIPTIGVDIYTPDFQTIARGFGCNAVKIESAAHLREELRKAHAAKRPTVIEIDDAAAQRLVGVRRMTSRSLTERAASAFIDGAWRTAGGPPIEAVDPSTGPAFAQVAAASPADVAAAAEAAARAFSVLAAHPRRGPGRLSARHRARRRGAAPRARGAADAQQRQAAARGGDRRLRRRRHVRLLCRAGRGSRCQAGHRCPDARRRIRRQDAVRAGRAGRHDRAVELPARHLRLEDRAGARRRLHGRAEDLGVHPADRARLRRHRRRRPSCPPGS